MAAKEFLPVIEILSYILPHYRVKLFNIIFRTCRSGSQQPSKLFFFFFFIHVLGLQSIKSILIHLYFDLKESVWIWISFRSVLH